MLYPAMSFFWEMTAQVPFSSFFEGWNVNILEPTYQSNTFGASTLSRMTLRWATHNNDTQQGDYQ